MRITMKFEGDSKTCSPTSKNESVRRSGSCISLGKLLAAALNEGPIQIKLDNLEKGNSGCNPFRITIERENEENAAKKTEAQTPKLTHEPASGLQSEPTNWCGLPLSEGNRWCGHY